jgi:hypothetical protein
MIYNPSNGVIAFIMRWPILGGLIAGIGAINTEGWLAAVLAFVAGSVAGAFGLSKLFKDQICDCEKDGYFKPEGSKLEWIVEYNPESGAERPWDVYTMFAGIEATKQHYASYATEENALKKIEVLKEMASKVTKK